MNGQLSERVPGAPTYRHSDGSECLWSATDQAWLKMHPLYPVRTCSRSHSVGGDCGSNIAGWCYDGTCDECRKRAALTEDRGSV